jgi:hypothetical protein
MKPVYYWKTRIGVFYIAQSADGRFHPVFDGEDLGSYATIQLALGDLTGGHVSPFPRGVDTSTLGISDELSEWVRCR